MSIKFSGTHMFKLDQPATGENNDKITRALVKGLNGVFERSQGTFRANIGGASQNHHLYVIQGKSDHEDQVILENAVRLGITPSSIESIDMNFLPMDTGSMKDQLFQTWVAMSGILLKKSSQLSHLLKKAASLEV